jgi:YggT family protein
MSFFDSLGRGLLTLIIFLLDAYTWAIIASAILSWGFLRPSNKVVRVLRLVTEPVISPCRQLLNRVLPFAWRRFDFSPILAILLINLLVMILNIIRAALLI